MQEGVERKVRSSERSVTSLPVGESAWPLHLSDRGRMAISFVLGWGASERFCILCRPVIGHQHHLYLLVVEHVPDDVKVPARALVGSIWLKLQFTTGTLALPSLYVLMTLTPEYRGTVPARPRGLICIHAYHVSLARSQGSGKD